MRNVILLLLLLTTGSAFAQSDIIINTVTLSITEGRFNDAEKYLDSLLKEDPKSIDALMMKGNVLLNYSIMATPPQNNITIDDESIYTDHLASLSHPTVVIPRGQALKIEKIWNQCIGIDSGRLDIREGLCTLYGMADMQEELLNYLPAIATAGKVKGDDFVAVLIQYAQLLSERGDKEGAYKVYRKIIELYPHLTFLNCLLIETCKAGGDLDGALSLANKTFEVKVDIAACEDALDIYGTSGEYVKLLKILKKDTGGDDSTGVYPFYDGIYRYAHHDPIWKVKLKEYFIQFTDTPSGNIDYILTSFMLSDNFKEDYEHTVRLLEENPGMDFFRGLILERAMSDFKDSVQIFLIAGQFATESRNYKRANTIFESASNKKMNTSQKADYNLRYAFSLYCAKEYKKAIALLNELPKSTNVQPVVNYFLGQCYFKSGEVDKAIPYFQSIVNSNDDSKYAYLAKLQLDKLIKK